MLPTDILCSSYPAWPPVPVLKTNLFTYPNVFSNILEFSLKARWCFSRLPGLWFCPLETGMMLVLVPPQQTQHNSHQGIHHWKREGVNQIIGIFSASVCPDFRAGYSRELQRVNPGLKWYQQAGVALVFVKYKTHWKHQTWAGLWKHRDWARSVFSTAQPAPKAGFLKVTHL